MAKMGGTQTVSSIRHVLPKSSSNIKLPHSQASTIIRPRIRSSRVYPKTNYKVSNYMMHSTNIWSNRTNFNNKHHRNLNRNQKKNNFKQICRRYPLICIFVLLLSLLLLGAGIAAMLVALITTAKTTTTITTVTTTTTSTTVTTSTTGTTSTVTTTTTTSVPPCSCSNCYSTAGICCYAGVCGSTGSTCYFTTNIGGIVPGSIRAYTYFCYVASFYGIVGCPSCVNSGK